MLPEVSNSFEAFGVVAEKASGESDTRCSSSLTWRWMARYCRKNAIVTMGVMATIGKYYVMWKVGNVAINGQGRRFLFLICALLIYRNVDGSIGAIRECVAFPALNTALSTIARSLC
jgi:hypothetical protein